MPFLLPKVGILRMILIEMINNRSYCTPQKLKILMKFMGPAWLDFKPYKILSELPCEVTVHE